MRKLPKRKEILVPLHAGLQIMERYGLYCQCQDTWSDPAIAESLDRIHSARAPHQVQSGGRTVQLNIASPNPDFRQKSVQVLERFIRQSARAPQCVMVVVPAAPHFWNEDAGAACEVREVGEYGSLIESLQYLARVAAEVEMWLVIENHVVPWDQLGPEEQYMRGKHHGAICEYFASSPNEWNGICEDVQAHNFGLCLDSSHAVTYAHRFPTDTRDGILGLFVALGGERIWHIHWSDNYMDEVRGRENNKLLLGKGTIPRSIHRDLWTLPNAHIYLFDHWTHEGELADATRYVERL